MDLDVALRRLEQAKNNRANWDDTFQQIADRVLPQMADFNTKREEGARRTEYMFDSTASLAAQKGVAAISTFIWPPNQRYQKLTSSNKALNKIKRVSEWMDAATDVLFQSRYSPRAAFESQMGETGLQFFVFGTGLIFTDDNIKQRALRYKSMHLARTYVLENAAGVIDTVFRCWNWTLRQLDGWIKERQAAGFKTADLPQQLAEKLRKNPEEQIEVCHMVMPREDWDPERAGYKGMPWASCYCLPGQKLSLEEGGFNTWPFGVMRCMTSPGEVYGRSPAWMALSDIKVLNAQKKTVLQAGQKVVDPPLLLSEDGILGAFSLAPGALNYGGLDAQGNQLVKPLITNAKVDIGLDMMDKQREIIASANLLDVFRVLIEHPDMTATQTLELLQERATLISPIGGRIESECLGPMTERELDLLVRAGQLPPMPGELIEAEGEYKIEYTSPMRQAMRASEAIAITRTFEAVLPLSEADPSVLDTFDLPAAARELAEIHGVPSKILRDIEDVKARQEDRAQQQQMQSLVDAAPAVSQAAANLTKMQAAGGRPQL